MYVTAYGLGALGADSINGRMHGTLANSCSDSASEAGLICINPKHLFVKPPTTVRGVRLGQNSKRKRFKTAGLEKAALEQPEASSVIEAALSPARSISSSSTESQYVSATGSHDAGDVKSNVSIENPVDAAAPANQSTWSSLLNIAAVQKEINEEGASVTPATSSASALSGAARIEVSQTQLAQPALPRYMQTQQQKHFPSATRSYGPISDAKGAPKAPVGTSLVSAGSYTSMNSVASISSGVSSMSNFSTNSYASESTCMGGSKANRYTGRRPSVADSLSSDSGAEIASSTNV